MVQTVENFVGACPLCGEEIRLDSPDLRVGAKWRDVLAHRDKWAAISQEFTSRRSVDEAAHALSLSPELARRVLEFLCLEICGCRGVTCTSCLDDYRSEL